LIHFCWETFLSSKEKVFSDPLQEIQSSIKTKKTHLLSILPLMMKK